jgi:hypothetical protein
MVFSLEHDIKVTKNHQNLLPTQSVLVAHTVLLRVEVSIFVLSPDIEDRDEVEVGNWAKHKMI